MNFLTSILTENRCYKTGQKIKPCGVMVHSTGANNPMLRRYVQSKDKDVQALLGVNKNHNDWNRPDLSVCVHAFIGKLDDGSVAAVQTLPWNHRGWHAGQGRKGSANDTHISFEMCEDDLTDPVYFSKAYETAAELTAALCLAYGLNPFEDGVVICHQDGFQRGIASNHSDIYNWFPRHNKTMNDFRRRVDLYIKEMTNDMKYYATFDDIPAHYKTAVKKVMDKGALYGIDDKGTLNVSEDFCRTMTVLDRLGTLD